MGQKKENVWLNLGFNIVAPSLILVKGKKIFESILPVSDNLDVIVFVSALAFPLAYGVYDLLRRRKWNIFSVIGLLSVVLTGGIGLMKLSRECMILKETIVPLVLGGAVLATALTKKPLAKMIMLNEDIVDVKKIDDALDARGTRAEYDSALKTATYWVSASFLLSAILNFALASYIFKSEVGTEAFNEEVGTMTALSFPVIAVPTTIMFIFAMYKFFGALSKNTGLSLEEIMTQKSDKKG
ncbi:MAG: MFS transporter [Opitutales bacterium]|nr:MFS transporter [Opitutales bacterium]